MHNNGYSIDFVGTRSVAAPDLDSDPVNGDPRGGYGYNVFGDFQSEGHGGKNSRYFRDNTLSAATWLPPTDPQVVLLHVGTNDFKSNNSPPPIVDYVSQTVDNIFSYRASAHVFVARIIGQHPDNFDNISTGDVTAFNNAVASTVSAISSRVHVVDQFSGIDYSTGGTANSDFGDTNKHPSQSSYNRMATRWYNSLRDSGLFERCP